jgi:hypothetical protein
LSLLFLACALAAFFWSFPRCVDFGDLSPMDPPFDGRCHPGGA